MNNRHEIPPPPTYPPFPPNQARTTKDLSKTSQSVPEPNKLPPKLGKITDTLIRQLTVGTLSLKQAEWNIDANEELDMEERDTIKQRLREQAGQKAKDARD
jgi:hypothetical protein